MTSVANRSGAVGGSVAPSPIPLSDGVRRWVPHNRWDLVAGMVDDVVPASCAIIVPYFEQPQSLERMYAAIAGSGLDPDRYELIVVDDGSAAPPPPPPADFALRTMMLRQEDRGCRPGAARDLGARSSSADCLVFLDADTLPAPATVARLARWTTMLPDALVVGSRHHAVLDGWSPNDLAQWLDGSGDEPEQRPDPVWLADAYAASRDLLQADDRSYRFVISGVMACSSALYDDAGGFDIERFHYGTEDWDLASRCFNAGAVMIHDPEAVAWHDEPDWSDRSMAADDGPADDVAAARAAARAAVDSKNEQWTWLADRVSDPAARGRAVIHGSQSLVCRLRFDAAAAVDTVSEIVVIESLLSAEPDMSIHLSSTTHHGTLDYVRHDPRVRVGEPRSDELRRARAVIDVAAPIDWTSDALQQLLAHIAPDGVGTVEIRDGERMLARATSTRAFHRVRRAGTLGLDPTEAMQALFGTQTIANDGLLRLLQAPSELAPMFDRPRRDVG